MKSLKYIIVLGIVTGVTFSSCEDWLDENPKYSVDNTVIFDSEETAKQALDACYGYLTTQDCFGQGVYEMSVGSSGLGTGPLRFVECHYGRRCRAVGLARIVQSYPRM